LFGGAGDDRLVGGGGKDRLDGGRGLDRCGGGAFVPERRGAIRAVADRYRTCEVETVPVLDQTVLFSGHDWRITDAVGSYESRFTFPDEDPDFTDQRRLYVTLQVTNNLSGDGAAESLFSDDEVRVKLPNGQYSSFEGLSINVEAGATEEFLVSFPVPDDVHLGALVLQLGNDEVEEVLLPLNSPVAPDRFPFAAELNLDAVNADMPGCTSGQAVSVGALSGTWSLELGDLDSIGPPPTNFRAAKGSRLLIVDFRVTGLADGACGGANVFDRYFRSEADGVATASRNQVSEGVRAGLSVDVTVAFLVPADVTDLNLLVGKFGLTVGAVDVIVPDLDRVP
jgi:hypothetical protein